MANYAAKRVMDNLLRVLGYRRLKLLRTPLTSTAWDGDAYSTAANATLDLSLVFGVPAGVVGVLLSVAVRDSAAWGTANLYFMCGANAAAAYALVARCYGGDVISSHLAPVPCDANGDIVYSMVASGVGTLDVWVRVWGYWY